MSSLIHSEQSNKLHTLDVALHDLPSPFDTALNSPTKPTKTNEGLLDPSSFHRYSTSSTLSSFPRSRSHSRLSRHRHASRSPAPRTWRTNLGAFWQRNRGLLLVSLSQFFGALMNVTTRLLELEGAGMHPFQVLFARMSITVACCCTYMWYTAVPGFPLGQKGIRALLVARGLTGFFGIFGMYYSLQYLPIADATVITFLAPAVASYGCHLFLGEQFSRIEQLSSLVSLIGVVLIARPTSFFHLSPEGASAVASGTRPASNSTGDHDYHAPDPTSAQRLTAIAISLLGVLGTAGAITAIRWIGKRAHPLITVNYFAAWSTLVSTAALALTTPAASPLHSDAMAFRLPAGVRQWGMLFALGACGFIMQFMLTEGLAHEKSSRANNMIYTQMLFALLFDRWVFGTVPGGWSWVGGGLVLGGALWGAIRRGKGEEERGREGERDEELGLLGGGEEGASESERREEVDLEDLVIVDEPYER